MKIRRSRGENIFNVFNIAFMIFMMAICLYPMLYVVFASFSEPSLYMAHTGMLWKPLGFSLASYQAVLDNAKIWTGYRNTIFIVVVGTFLNVVFTSMAAFFLSRKGVPGQRFITMAIMFTMYFSGGMIPGYLNIQSLGLYDSTWALILPVLVNTFNLIILRTSMAAIDASLEESAQLDGAGYLTILIRIIIPLVKPALAVQVLYYGVYHWNSWFNAMLYLESSSKEPLQMVLRSILILNDTASMDIGSSDAEMIGETIKQATIVVSTLPILCLYPFLQKYFVKGMMVGAVKG